MLEAEIWGTLALGHQKGDQPVTDDCRDQYEGHEDKEQDVDRHTELELVDQGEVVERLVIDLQLVLRVDVVRLWVKIFVLLQVDSH